VKPPASPENSKRLQDPLTTEKGQTGCSIFVALRIFIKVLFLKMPLTGLGWSVGEANIAAICWTCTR